MLRVKYLLYFSSNDSVNAVFLPNFPNSIFCKQSVGGLVVVVHCSEIVCWNGDIAILPNGIALGTNTMKFFIRDTACVGYEFLIRDNLDLHFPDFAQCTSA
jgi:hypothetical protein